MEFGSCTRRHVDLDVESTPCLFTKPYKKYKEEGIRQTILENEQAKNEKSGRRDEGL